MVRLLMKWVKAGVLEEGKLHETQKGLPQGATISPLLSNLYLHYVFDLWICHWRKKCAQGEVYVVRYADALVVGLQKEQDGTGAAQGNSRALLPFRTGATSGKDPGDRVRAFCPTGSRKPRAAKA